MLFFLLEYALFVIALIALILGWYHADSNTIVAGICIGGLAIMIYSNLDWTSRRDKR